jgi:DNA-binding NarL/FixJ family response regulator
MNPTPSAPARVVVVDDSEDMRFLVHWTLERDDDFHVVAEAADGHEAIARVREHRPDVVLLDISMPGMSGLEALPVIRAESPETVVVMLSTMVASDARAEESLALGAHAYLPKSAKSHLLPDQVRKILNDVHD